ncbi:MAG: tetratricopeptide repeat protein [Myxococcales bacterium]|nr:tetratricopeptide repeat protein [Myxococcales bacterium]
MVARAGSARAARLRPLQERAPDPRPAGRVQLQPRLRLLLLAQRPQRRRRVAGHPRRARDQTRLPRGPHARRPHLPRPREPPRRDPPLPPRRRAQARLPRRPPQPRRDLPRRRALGRGDRRLRRARRDRFYATPGHGHNNLGWAWYKKREPGKARIHLERAIKLAPELCPAYNNLGLVLIDADEFEAAARTLERAVRRCPSYAEPHYHLGRVEAQRQNLTEARSQFTRCRELAGDAPLGDRCAQRLAALPPAGQP